MKLGIVGLPNVGKSTLFNAITEAGAEAANYPFCTIEPNVGVVPVPDERVEYLTEVYNSKKTIYTTIEFCDIAGLVKGASKGEGLGNKFLGHIRNVDAIVHVVRCFEDPNVVHVDGVVDPVGDIETINLELIISDLELLYRRLEKTKKMLKGDKKLQVEIDVLEDLVKQLEDGKSARMVEADEFGTNFIASLDLLSFKPIIYACNVSEEELIGGEGAESSEMVKLVKDLASREGSDLVIICAKIEEELSMLDRDEKIEFLKELGIEKGGLEKLIKASYRILNLISFITTGEDETRAWTVTKGTKAPAAAGKIHTDFEKGFIRAETISFEKLVECKGKLSTAKEKGLLRSEGKAYEVVDGDIMHFLFNV